ncbi:MAG TPA: hypothetical protein VF989_15705 [Polyangiaceae bacterium]
MRVGPATLSGDPRKLFRPAPAVPALDAAGERPFRRLLSNVAVPGFERFGVGDFTFWREDGPERVVFATTSGLYWVDPRSGAVETVLSERGAWRLRYAADLLGSALVGTEARGSTVILYRMLAAGTLEVVLELEFAERVDDWALSPDRRRLAVIEFPSNRVSVLDFASGKPLFSEPAPAFVSSVDLSPDGRLLAVGGDHLRVIDLEHPKRRAVYRGFLNNLHRVRFTPNGKAVVASSYDGRIRVFGAGTSRA